MVHCYNYIVESIEVVLQVVKGSSDTSFQLNENQCQILVGELVETNVFLEKKGACYKFGEGVETISLQHLCSAIKRAEVLVKKCYCKDLESWLVSAMMLVEIQEEFMAIILDIHLWRMLLDFAITCGRGLSLEKKVEEMKIIDEEYHQLFKDLRRESHALQQAAMEDKKTIISRASRIAKFHESTRSLDYLRAIYLQSWLSSSVAIRNMGLEKWEPIHLLGQGASGAVMKVKWLGIECALKMLGGQDEKEATALKGLFHPNIIRLFHYWDNCPEHPQSCLLMELMPKDLGAYMSFMKMQMGKDSMPFSLPVAIDIMYQIAQAMRYMHDRHLTHRDLKPGNVLVRERSQMGLSCIDGDGYLDIKLADFGLVKSYTNTSTFHAPSKNKGTGMYRAPELFGKDMSQKRHYLPMADVWSFGITCAEILSGKLAYSECVDMYGLDIQTMIREKGLRPTLPKHCPPYLAFCIKSCWEYLPSRRPTFASLCKLLRHAKLLSLGVMKLNDSKFFFAYITRSDQVQSLDLSPSPSIARISTFFQSSLKFMGIGSRRVPNVAKAGIVHEVRLVSTSSITKDSSELHEDIGTGGIATPGGLTNGERHYSTALRAIDFVHEERVVSTPTVTKESPLRMADKDVARRVATSANPTQMIESLPHAQDAAELYQASLDNAISSPDASDSIQPTIIPISGRISIMSKNQGEEQRRKMVGGIEEDAVVKTTGRHPRINFVRKNKEPSGVLSDTQKQFEGKSVESELPKLRKASSASDVPTAHSWNQSIILPKPSPPADPEVIRRHIASSSSSRGDHNISSREALDYQFRALPPGSYQDDGTRPFLKNLLKAIMEVKFAVNHFAEVFIMDMNECLGEEAYQYFLHTILREIKADIDRAKVHWKFLVQAFICRQLFDGFDSPNGYFGVEYFENEQMTKLISFTDFWQFKHKASIISMLLNSDSPDDSFLGRFCFKKFKSISGYFNVGQLFSFHQEEWDTIERERHPKTEFYQSFLEVAVSVWLVHRLVHSFKEKVEMLIYENGANFQRQTMESVVLGSYKEADEEVDAKTKVGFSVIPGFRASGSVVKCEVYLCSRSRHLEMEITRSTSSDKIPVKPPSNKPRGKTLSGKTSMKSHTFKLPVRDSQSHGILPPPEGSSSSSHYINHYPPLRVGDDGLAVRGISSFWRPHREGLNLGKQGSVNGSGCKNKYEWDSSSEAFFVRHGQGSYQDDDTRPSLKTLLKAVMEVKSAVNHFAEVLITNMSKYPVEQASEYFLHMIRRDIRPDMDRSNHWKFLVQAFICKRLFDGFDAPNGYFDVEYFENDQMTKLISFADFSKFKDRASIISMLLESYSPDDSFLGRFCFKKFKSISGYSFSNRPLPIYKEEWDVIKRECHPKTMFYQSFLKVAVSVWLVHRLVHSFEEKVEMLIYEKGSKFQRQTMECVVPGSYEEENEEADGNSEVDFSVIPGFQVSESVVKCEVYLRSKSRILI